MNPIEATLQLEHVLPQKYATVAAWTRKWDTDSAGEWMHRLGNLALLNQKVNAKISNGPFETKKDLLALSIDTPDDQARHLGRKGCEEPSRDSYKPCSFYLEPALDSA